MTMSSDDIKLLIARLGKPLELQPVRLPVELIRQAVKTGGVSAMR